jgi:hypothetical protein
MGPPKGHPAGIDGGAGAASTPDFASGIQLLFLKACHKPPLGTKHRNLTGFTHQPPATSVLTGGLETHLTSH